MEPITYAPFGQTNPGESARTMTKREAFAQTAMQAILTANADNQEGYNYHMVARDAVGIADALINALNHEQVGA